MPRKDAGERRAYDKKYLKGYRQAYGKCVTELRNALRDMPPVKLIAMLSPLSEEEQALFFKFMGRIRSKG